MDIYNSYRYRYRFPFQRSKELVPESVLLCRSLPYFDPMPTTPKRLLLEQRCFVLLTSNATDTATCLGSWSSVIKDQKRQLLLAPLLLLPMDADSQGDPSANNRAAASISCELFQAATAQSGGLKLTGPASAPEVQLCLKATTGISKDACLPFRVWLCVVFVLLHGVVAERPHDSSVLFQKFTKSFQNFQQLCSQGNCVIAAG